MDKIEKTLRYNSLFLIYQNLLTDTQKEIMMSYFVYDLSLSEISEERNISRAAAEDAIKKGMNKLDEFENELHLLQKKEVIQNLLNELKQNGDEKTVSIIEQIERNL